MLSVRGHDIVLNTSLEDFMDGNSLDISTCSPREGPSHSSRDRRRIGYLENNHDDGKGHEKADCQAALQHGDDEGDHDGASAHDPKEHPPRLKILGVKNEAVGQRHNQAAAKRGSRLNECWEHESRQFVLQALPTRWQKSRKKKRSPSHPLFARPSLAYPVFVPSPLSSCAPFAPKLYSLVAVSEGVAVRVDPIHGLPDVIDHVHVVLPHVLLNKTNNSNTTTHQNQKIRFSPNQK